MNGKPPARELRDKFDAAVLSANLGTATALHDLGGAAFACITSPDKSNSAVAFALGTCLQILARDMDERPVTVIEAQNLVIAIHDPIAHSITFIEAGGTADEAIDLIAILAGIAVQRVPAP